MEKKTPAAPDSTTEPIRVLLLDHHTLVREGMQLLLAGQSGIEIAGGAGSSSEALALCRQSEPDIILLELNLDGELNTEIIPGLLAAAPHAQVILVTGIDEIDIHHLAVQMGAMGVVPKMETHQVLLKAIEKVHAGEVWIDRTMMANVLAKLSRARLLEQDNPEKAKIALLSEREKDVISLIGQGLKNRDIASRLSISETTVRHHLTSIYSKLHVTDRLELIIYAYRNGLAELPM
jgi:DNA-binding NarL/FixJ family response regulator